MKKILVIGSINIDFDIRVHDMPQKGETITSLGLEFIPGGKGANQAFTMGRLNADVTMLGAVGKDTYGQKAVNNLYKASVNIDKIKYAGSTGSAFICIDDSGENSIVLDPGANSLVDIDYIKNNINLIKNTDIIVMQLEIPLETVAYVAKLANEYNKTLILDPAPARKDIPDEVFKYVDVIKPNETEIATLTGCDNTTNEGIIEGAKQLLNKGVKNVIVTLGKSGSMLINSDGTKCFDALKVETVDSTAAGDSFTGALVAKLASGASLEDAIKFGHIVSAIVVTKKGATSSIPSIREVNSFIKNNGSSKSRIVIDADPGVDDAFAIMYALSCENLKVEGITTVEGNCGIDNATTNTLKLVNYCERNDIEVYEGAKKALVKETVDATDVHGNDGIGGVDLGPCEKTKNNQNAVDYLIDLVNSNPNEIIITALGPLTNIAMAIMKDNNFAKNVKSLIIMGGSSEEGNITKYAEFNFYKDPLAAKIVLESGIKDICLFPLDVTRQIPLSKKWENYLLNSKTKTGKHLYDMTRVGAVVDRKRGHAGLIINDPITIMYLTNPEIMQYYYAKIAIVIEGHKEGQSLITTVSKSNIKVFNKIDSNKFFKIMFNKILTK